MNIYKVSRTDNINYDEYDSMIVAANDEQDARTIHPQQSNGMDEDDIRKWKGENPGEDDDWYMGKSSWVMYKKINTLTVELIGKATKGIERGIILASYNAG